MVAAVGDVEIVARQRQTHGKPHWQRRLAAAPQAHRIGIEQLRRQLRDQRRHTGIEFAQTAFADDALAHIALAVEQHDRRPGLDAVVLPQRPVAIVGDRKLVLLRMRPLAAAAHLALGIETRHMDRDHLQPLAMPRAQMPQIRQTLLAPGRAQVDERDRTDLAAHLGHAQRVR